MQSRNIVRIKQGSGTYVVSSRGVADAIAARNPTAAHDAMYLHLVYNRNMIAESKQGQ